MTNLRVLRIVRIKSKNLMGVLNTNKVAKEDKKKSMIRGNLGKMLNMCMQKGRELDI